MPTNCRSLSFFPLSAVLFGGILAITTTHSPAADAAPEIVVAMRYPQEQGESHAHLFLYRQNGKLLRQLTRDDTGQDRNPAFSDDGATIVFTREKGKDANEIWSIEPRGGNLHRLKAAPDWYVQTITFPHYASLGEEINWDNPPSYETPDHSVEITLATSKTDEDDQVNGEGHGKHYKLKDEKTSNTVELGTLPGFVGLYAPLGCLGETSNYLIAPPLRVIFFDLHLNSTDGNTVFALDLNNKKFVRLSPNGAMPVLLPEEPAFLTLTEVRYVPYGGGQHTANSTYVERWDASLNKVRYADGEKAGSCYGASMYRPGKKGAVISIRDSTWKEAEPSPDS